ncbi:multidrug effflux MFS transporter [Microvirga lotononidis]|uniref:Bcr/CflA family efflux transporter n=1 Tax=Microvirga lotononidis TaxID=864069 RepID=I4YN07_9HYPH|nr:multidrug effflux MFS transporter [Microvirga lotononidis]EIM25349.1 drug resistance transporter, Bcr/CflA subfamily [Microvirga lotononidis]WQO27350.1 multidrug effflux MFS transporter [Microvirga lotononidis]
MIRKFDPNSLGFLALVALFGGLAALGTDMALSGVPHIASVFSVSPSTVGLTLSAFMVGFAGSPLVYGPVSDRFGRKPVILVSTAIYTLAGLGCALSPSFETLVVWRFVQGCGAGASRALSAAIIRDLFSGSAGRSKQSYVQVMQLLAPLSAPTIGSGLLLLFHNWRSIYFFLAATGALTFALMMLCYAESHQPDAQNRLSVRQLAVNYLRVFTTRQSVKFLLVQTLMFGGLFSYVTGSPLVMMEVYGLSPTFYGATFALTASGIVAGSFINGRLNARGVEPRYPLITGLVMGATCGGVLLVLTSIDALPLSVLLPLVVLVCLSFGLVGGNAVQLALDPMGDIAGLASSMLSASSLGFGAAMGVAVSLFHNGTPLSTVASMTACSTLALAVYRVL